MEIKRGSHTLRNTGKIVKTAETVKAEDHPVSFSLNRLLLFLV